MSRPLIPLARRGINAVAGTAIFWTPERVAVLERRYNIPGETNKAIARDIGCTLNALRCAAVRLGITRNRPTPGHWSPAQLDLLRRFYGVVETATLGRQLGRTVYAVHRKAQQLGLSYQGNAQVVALQQMRVVRELRVLLALHIGPHHYITEGEAELLLGLPIREIHQRAVRHAAAGARELDQRERRRA